MSRIQSVDASWPWQKVKTEQERLRERPIVRRTEQEKKRVDRELKNLTSLQDKIKAQILESRRRGEQLEQQFEEVVARILSLGEEADRIDKELEVLMFEQGPRRDATTWSSDSSSTMSDDSVSPSPSQVMTRKPMRRFPSSKITRRR